MKKFIFTLIFILTISIEGYSQTVTLTPIGTQDVSGIPVQVEHFVNYVPNHAISSVTYNPLGTNGTSVGLTDDSNVGPFNIGFNFEFYGQTFIQFRICTNGFITFGDQSGRYSPGSFPEAAAPNGVIAAYWTDLFPSPGYYTNYRTEGTTPNRKLVVSAHLTYYSNRNAWVDYQIVLFEGTNKVQTTITSQGWTTTATQGVENHQGTLAATPPGRNLSSFNGAGTTFEYTPMALVQGWESQGTKNTNSSGQVSFTNSLNWPYRVTINTSQKTHLITDFSLNYMMFMKANLGPLQDWDFYTCDCNNSTTFEWEDIRWCWELKRDGVYHNKYIFTQSEKTTIESNPNTNYYNTYFPNQLRTIENQNQFYIMGTGIHKSTTQMQTIQ
jgi:hypothetical protein